MSDVPPPSQAEEDEETQPEDTDPELRRSQRFWAMLEATPRDVSGVDFRPLYGLARLGDEIRAVNDREDSWEPRPEDRLNDKYPGPIGKFGRPSPRNLDRWNLVQSQAIEAYRNELQGHIEVVYKGEGHKAIVMAMQLLYEAAFAQDGAEKTDNIFVPKGVTSEDMAASIAALRAIQIAVDELGRIAEVGVKRQREYLIAELNSFERLRGQAG